MIKNDEEVKKIFEDLGRKIGAIHLFAILKSLEYKDLEWLDRLCDSRIDLNLFDGFITSRLVKPEVIRMNDIEDLKLDELFKHSKDWSYYFRLHEKDINRLLVLLKTTYPDIVPHIESLLKNDEPFSENAV